MDKSDVSWTGPTRMSTESLPSKALSMTSGAVLSPVGDSEPLDRSISQPNIAGGLKLPATVPPSPTVLASCSSTSSDLSRGGYASADSLGSVSSKDDMLSAPLTSEETQSLTTERSTRSASPCHENIPSVSLTVEEQSERSLSLSASLEPTPDLVLNLPTMSENTAVVHALCPTLTSAEMFASAEHGTIKKSATPGRSSVSGEDGASVEEVFPQTPAEITQALECENFSFDLLPAPPPAVTNVPEVVMKSADEECELPSDNLPDLSLRHESLLQETSSTVALPPCTDSLPSTSAVDSCSIRSTEEPAAVCAPQFKLISLLNTESVADAPEVSSSESFASTKNGGSSSELKSSDLIIHPPEPSVSQLSSVETTCKSSELESVDKLRHPSYDASDLSEEVCSDGTNVAVSAAELQSQPESSVALVAPQYAVLSADHRQEVVPTEQLPTVSQPVAVAAVLPVDAASSGLLSAQAAVTASGASDVLHFPPVTSSVASSNTETELTVQLTTSESPAQLRQNSCASPRPCSSSSCTVPSVNVSPQPDVTKTYHSTVGRRSSESAVPQLAVSHQALATHNQATSVAVASLPEPLPHRPPPSLAAHSAALQLLSQKHESSTVTVTGAGAPVEKPETSTKLEPSPSERQKSKPPPIKKKPSGPLKEKFFSAFGDHHQQ